MAECFITFELSTDDSEKTFRLIQGFHNLYKLDCDDLDAIKSVMDLYFGGKFYEIIYQEVSTGDHIRLFEKFLKKELLDNVDDFIFKLQFRACNELRLWQDSSDGNPDMREISPSQIKLETSSRPAGGSTWDRLELHYDSDENYLLKAAVFAAAFKSMGFDIDEMSSFDEYEDEYEDVE